MKALLQRPISTKMDFAAGGSRIPIVTRVSGQSTAGVQTFGLPMNNKTTLGAFRMGDADGNAPGSAIYPGDIFSPLPARDRVYPQRTFENVGNNVFQPPDDGLKLHALIKSLGDQKAKYAANAPFAEYMATQKLAKEVDESARGASLEDLGHAREIMRNLVATRRKQNEDDYLRRMIDSGVGLDNAQEELENVRKANAIHEAKKIDDRTYQAKILIQRIANSRGITSSTKEPLNTSGAIENPQPDQQTAALLGTPEAAFGASPLDTSREFLTPDFYKRYLRRSRLTQEAADEQTAINNLISTGESVSTLPMVQSQEREVQIENARDSVAARLEALRQRGNRIMIPLPTVVFGRDIIEPVYRRKNKASGKPARFTLESIQDAPAFVHVVSINQSLVTAPNDDKRRQLVGYLQAQQLERRDGRPVPHIRDILKNAAILLHTEENQYLPFAGDSIPLNDEQIVRALDAYKSLEPGMARAVEAARRGYVEDYLAAFDEPEAARGRTADEFLRGADPRAAGGGSLADRMREQLLARGLALPEAAGLALAEAELGGGGLPGGIPRLAIAELGGAAAGGAARRPANAMGKSTFKGKTVAKQNAELVRLGLPAAGAKARNQATYDAWYDGFAS